MYWFTGKSIKNLWHFMHCQIYSDVRYIQKVKCVLSSSGQTHIEIVVDFEMRMISPTFRHISHHNLQNFIPDLRVTVISVCQLRIRNTSNKASLSNLCMRMYSEYTYSF